MHAGQTQALATSPETPRPHLRESLADAARAMSANRGKARQVQLVLDRSMIPMLLVDHQRRYLYANRAARLVFRMSLAEFREKRIDDLTPESQVPGLVRAWHQLVTKGCVAGHYDVRFPDSSRLEAEYCALANLLPGQHLIVFAPADWPEDELGQLEDGSVASLAGPLSPREREVLSLVATGANLHQVADALTISPATVRTHLGNAHRKLGARNRAHAVALALQEGLIDLTELGVRD